MCDDSKATIIIWKTSCGVCGQKFMAHDIQRLDQRVWNHLNSRCPMAEMMDDWERKGFHQGIMHSVMYEACYNNLKKAVEKFGIERVYKTLQNIEYDKIIKDNDNRYHDKIVKDNDDGYHIKKEG